MSCGWGLLIYCPAFGTLSLFVLYLHQHKQVKSTQQPCSRLGCAQDGFVQSIEMGKLNLGAVLREGTAQVGWRQHLSGATFPAKKPLATLY